MPDIAPSIPVAGQPNSTEEPKIVTALTQLVSAVNNVDSAQISATAGILDTQLASPNNAVWRTYRSQPFRISAALAAADYYFDTNGSPFATGVASSNVALLPISIPTLTDFTLAGKTAQARVLAHSLTNATASGVTFGFNLYPINSVSGGGAVVTLVLSPLVAGSTATLTPTAASYQQAAGSAFTLPSGVSYVLGVSWTGTTAVSSVCSGVVDLQVRFT